MKALKDKAEFYSQRNKVIIENTMSFLGWKDVNKLADLSIKAMKSLETLEISSLSDFTKAKSLQGRHFTKTEPKNEKDISALIEAKIKDNKDEIFIERNGLVKFLATFTLT